MKYDIKKIHTKFDELQQREKIMVAGLLVVLLYISWQVVLFDASVVTELKIKNQIKAQQMSNNSLKVEIAAYQDRVINNPNSKLKQQQHQYLKKIEILDVKLNLKMKGLINPKRMTLMLKDIFRSNVSLTLVSLNKLATQSIFDFSGDNKTKQSDLLKKELSVTDDVNTKAEVNAVVYRHPVQIVFTGSYLNTLAYLVAIEKMPWDLYWDKVQLDVEQYPKAKIVITVFTLSLKKGWVGV